MDNAQKAIMIGVGLFITIIIISAVLLIVNIGQNLIGSATEQMQNISSSLQGTLTSTYDGKRVTGTDVIDAVNRYSNDDNISIRIVVTDAVQFETGAYSVNVETGDFQTARSGGVVCTPVGDSNVYTASRHDTVPAIQAQVSSTQTYFSYTLRDSESGTVMGVLFVRQNAGNGFDGGEIPTTAQ